MKICGFEVNNKRRGKTLSEQQQQQQKKKKRRLRDESCEWQGPNTLHWLQDPTPPKALFLTFAYSLRCLFLLVKTAQKWAKKHSFPERLDSKSAQSWRQVSHKDAGIATRH